MNASLACVIRPVLVTARCRPGALAAAGPGSTFSPLHVTGNLAVRVSR